MHKAIRLYFAMLQYLFIAIHFQVFRKYNNLPDKEKPKSNDDKIDRWMTTFSKMVNYNLTPLFEFWGLPLSEQAKASVSGLEAFFPDDEITQEYGPDQAAAILKKYPDVIRIPAGHSSVEKTTPRHKPVSVNMDEVNDESYSEEESSGEESENEIDDLWMGSTYPLSNVRMFILNDKLLFHQYYIDLSIRVDSEHLNEM